MPSPQSSLATLRPDLAASFEQFDTEADELGYIANKVAPTIEVAAASGSFGKIPLAQLLQNRDDARAPGSGYSRGKFTFDDASFATKERGAEDPVDDNEATMYRSYFDAERISTRRCFNVIRQNREKRWAAKLFNTATWTGASLYTDIATAWTVANLATMVPLNDVEAATLAVYDASGLWPNALILSKKLFRIIRRCSQIIDMVKYNGIMDVRAGNITADALAQAFDLKHVIVAGGTKNSANEGQTATPAQIWGTSYAMVARIAETDDPREPCVARSFHWAEDGSEVDGRVETYRDETVRGDVVRVRNQVDEIVMYEQAAHLMKVD